MFNKLQSRVYRELRQNAGLTQRQLAESAGLSRRNLQRIEKGEKIATAAEAAAIVEATECTRLFFAELTCKAMSEEIGLRVSIHAGGDLAYRAATPDAQASELLREAEDLMPSDLWWAWQERIGRHKSRGLLHEQEGFAMVRDLIAERDFHRQRAERSGAPRSGVPEEEEASEERPGGETSGDER